MKVLKFSGHNYKADLAGCKCFSNFKGTFFVHCHRVRHGKTGGSGRVNRVTGQNESFLNGSIGLRVESGCESGQVDPYFSKKKIFFF